MSEIRRRGKHSANRSDQFGGGCSEKGEIYQRPDRCEFFAESAGIAAERIVSDYRRIRTEFVVAGGRDHQARVAE